MGLCVSDLPDYPLQPKIDKQGLPQEDGKIPKEKLLAYYQATLEHNTYSFLAAAGQSNHAVAVLQQLPADERQEFWRILYANPEFTDKWGEEAHQYFFACAKEVLNT